jgi:hypothetical protein
MRQGQVLAAGIGVACVLAIVLVAFDSVWPDWTGLKGRTLWDIAELVLVPLSLAGIALVHAEVGAALLDEKTMFDKALLISARLSEAYPYARSELARVGKADQERAEADWLAAIQGASWTGAAYDYSTKWPAGFDPQAAGAHDRSD